MKKEQELKRLDREIFLLKFNSIFERKSIRLHAGKNNRIILSQEERNMLIASREKRIKDICKEAE